MQTKHNVDALAMELRLPCIKPPKLYLKSINEWEQITIRWDYKSDVKIENSVIFRFLAMQHFLKRQSWR